MAVRMIEVREYTCGRCGKSWTDTVQDDYSLTCVEAVTNGGIFILVDPNGITIAQDITIAAGAGGVIVFTGAGITFKITDAGTDFAVADYFVITVAAGSLKLKETVAAGVDGSEIPQYIAPREIDALSGDVSCDVLGPCIISVSQMVFQGAETLATRIRDKSYYDHLRAVGIITETEMIESFARQVKSFISGGADSVLIETMTDLGEMKCALVAVKDNSDFEAVCSMTFDKGVKGYATMMGVTPDRAAAGLEEAGADVAGSNCGSGIENIIEIARIMKPSTGLPLWFKPNAGLPELIDGKTVYRETPEEMASRIPELADAGAKIIGGCCGTTPGHIRKIREIIESL